MWLLLLPLAITAAGGGLDNTDGTTTSVVFALGIFAPFWLVAGVLGVVWWWRGYSAFLGPVLLWFLMPVTIVLLGIPFLFRGYRRSLRPSW